MAMTEDAATRMARMDERLKNVEKATDIILRKLEGIEINIINRLERVESSKLSATDFVTFRGDIEDRLRRLERFFWGASAIIGLIQFLGLSVLIYILRIVLK